MGGASHRDRRPHDAGDVLLEAAHCDPPSVARAARRHKLPSEASKRFERGGRPAAAAGRRRARRPAARRVRRRHDRRPAAPTPAPHRAPVPVAMPLDLPDRVAGVRVPARRHRAPARADRLRGRARHRRRRPRHVVTATPPSWRPDLVQPADLVEEVLRLEGLRRHPVGAARRPGRPRAHPRRSGAGARSSRALAEAGYVEVLPFPFVGPAVVGRVRPARRRRAPAHRARREPARRRARRARHHAAARPARHAGAQPRPAGSADLALFAHRPGRPAARAAGADARPGRRPAADRRRARRSSRPPCPPSPCTSAVVLAGDRERARLVGPGPAGELGRRGRGRAAGRRRGGRASCG